MFLYYSVLKKFSYYMVLIFLFSQDIKHKIFYQLMTLFLSGYLILFTISVFSVLCNEYEVAVKRSGVKCPRGAL